MAKMTLREYANQWLKNKGTTATKAKKNASKYKSIAAAKKAGSLYYTDKNGKVQLAVYAEDLKRGISPKPKLRPGSKKPGPQQGPAAGTGATLEEKNALDRANKRMTTREITEMADKAITSARTKPKPKTKKEPTKFGPYYDTWRKSNSGGIVAYRKDMEKKGLKPRTSAGNR